MSMIPADTLSKARLGRASARHLQQLVATRTLTESDVARLLRRIQEGFDAVLGPAEPPPARPGLVAIDGGRK